MSGLVAPEMPIFSAGLDRSPIFDGNRIEGFSSRLGSAQSGANSGSLIGSKVFGSVFTRMKGMA